MRLGLGQHRAQETRHGGALPARTRQRGRRLSHHGRADAGGFLRGERLGIRVAPGKLKVIAHPVEERLGQFLVRRGAETDRVGGACIHGDAVVRIRGRQVQHVAGHQDGVVGRDKTPQDPDRQSGPQRQIVLPPIAPPAPPEALQQEHVVGIDVRPDAAARRRIAHHQVVKPRKRQEGKTTQQCVGRIAFQVCALDQQRPVPGRQRAQCPRAERTVLQRPRAAVADQQPRLHIVALRHGKELRTGVQAGKIGDRAAHQQGVLLPVPAQKCRGGLAAQQGPARGRRAGHQWKPTIASRGDRAGGAYNAPVRLKPDRRLPSIPSLR